MQTTTQEDAPRALSIKQFCASYSVSPAKFYLLVNRGELTARKIGTLLASMRVASLNLKSWSNEIDAIGVALRGNLMTMDDACRHLDDMGILYWLPDSEQVAA